MYYPAYPNSPLALLRRIFSGLSLLIPRRPAGAKSAPRTTARGTGMLLLVLLSIAIVLALYNFLLPTLGDSRLSQMLLERGPMQPVTLGAAILGLSVLVQRLWRGRGERQRVRMLMHAAWPDFAQPASDLRSWCAGLPIPVSWITVRLRRLIDANAAGEAATSAAERLAQADRGRLQDLYQLPRLLAGALPMLGLAGTVFGLSGGMGRVAGIIGKANDIDDLRQLLTAFSGSLAAAFDTTLLALMLLAPLLVLQTLAQRSDEATLVLIDACCERLVPLMENPSADDPDEQLVRRATDRVLIAFEAGIAKVLERVAAQPANALDSDAMQAMVQLPQVLDQVRLALVEPRMIEVRVAPPDNHK